MSTIIVKYLFRKSTRTSGLFTSLMLVKERMSLKRTATRLFSPAETFSPLPFSRSARKSSADEKPSARQLFSIYAFIPSRWLPEGIMPEQPIIRERTSATAVGPPVEERNSLLADNSRNVLGRISGNLYFRRNDVEILSGFSC